MRSSPRGSAEAGFSTYGIHEGASGKEIGAVECREGVPEAGWLGFEGVEVARELRGLGLESEAVRLLEGAAIRRGRASRFWAAVSGSDGLGLYFWLRLGYRPARGGEAAWREESGSASMIMVRVRERE